MGAERGLGGGDRHGDLLLLGDMGVLRPQRVAGHAFPGGVVTQVHLGGNARVGEPVSTVHARHQRRLSSEPDELNMEVEVAFEGGRVHIR